MKTKIFFIYTGKATAQMEEFEIVSLNYTKHSPRFKLKKISTIITMYKVMTSFLTMFFQK